MSDRFLVLTELFLPTKGGTAVWFDAVYRRLGDRDTHVVTARVPGDTEHDASHPNTVHRLRLERWQRLKPSSAPVYARFWRSAWNLTARHRFDAVHAGRVLPEGLIAVGVARARGLPCVVYAHGEEITAWQRLWKRRAAMLRTYRHADAVVANSSFTREQLLALGVPAERLHVIYPGVDAERFRPGPPESELVAAQGLPSKARIVLSVGRLVRRKGFDRVIEALPSLLAEGIDVHYVVIGTGEDREHLLSKARTAGVGDRVHLLGHVAMDDLPAWYRTCDVFAMPNRAVGADAEGFGMVYAEAAASGKPAVAGLHGGTGDAVVDGETGLRVDGERPEEVASALRRLLTDTALARRLGAAGRKRVERELSWDRVADKTRRLHKTLREGRH